MVPWLNFDPQYQSAHEVRAIDFNEAKPGLAKFQKHAETTIVSKPALVSHIPRKGGRVCHIVQIPSGLSVKETLRSPLGFVAGGIFLLHFTD